MSDLYETLSEASVEMALDVTSEAEVVEELEGIFFLELEEAGVEIPKEYTGGGDAYMVEIRKLA